MSQINPFVGAIAQTPQAQRAAAADRDAQVRRTQERQNTTGYTDQPIDEYVESADAVEAVGQDDRHQDPRRRKRKPKPQSPGTQPPGDDKPHLDVRA